MENGSKHDLITSYTDSGFETALMIHSDEPSHHVDLGRDEGPRSPPHSTPSSAPTKKIKFNMSSKIQIIPNNRQGQLNTGYIGTMAGVLKLAEIFLAFIAFVLSICSDRKSTTAAWTEHITFETMMVVVILLLGYVCFPHLTLHNEPTREGLIVVELLFYGVNTLFYFISIWLMVHLSASWGVDGKGSAIMGAVVCVALTVIFAIETVMKLKAWKGENAPQTTIVNGGNTQA